ncbi:MAG: ferrous iron transport protein A [Syntrophaceae bacterium]|nr:ferrous iron transport protein A [Syntrophaceae bacterium]
MLKSLNQLKPDERGVITAINGGQSLINRLNALGIRPGKIITKVSSMFMHGPVTVQIDRSQVAIGLGMAKKILIRTDREEE